MLGVDREFPMENWLALCPVKSILVDRPLSEFINPLKTSKPDACIFFKPFVLMIIFAVSSGSFLMAYMSSYADVTSKSPSIFKVKPSFFSEILIPKFDATEYFLLFYIGTENPELHRQIILKEMSS